MNEQGQNTNKTILRIGNSVTVEFDLIPVPNKKWSLDYIFRYDPHKEHELKLTETQKRYVAYLLYYYCVERKGPVGHTILNRYMYDHGSLMVSEHAVKKCLKNVIKRDFWNEIICYEDQLWSVKNVIDVSEKVNQYNSNPRTSDAISNNIDASFNNKDAHASRKPNVLVRFKNDIDQFDESIFYELRETYIDDIKNSIENASRSILSIWGEGGLGKTTTAIWLYKYYRFNSSFYNGRVGWVRFNDSFEKSIVSAFDIDGNRINQEERISLIKEYLSSDRTQRSLLILDDLSRDAFLNDKSLLDFFSIKNVDFVITTRVNESIKLPTRLPISWKRIPMLSPEEGRVIFNHYFRLETSDEDNKCIRDFVENRLLCNPLAIEVVAKTAREILVREDIGLKEYFERISELRSVDSDVGVYTNYMNDTDKEYTLQHILRSVYSMSDLNSSEKEIVSSFSILPNVSIRKKDITQLFDISIDDAMCLCEKGWIKYTPGAGFSMHDIIKSMLRLDIRDNPYVKGIKPDDYDDYHYFYESNTKGIACPEAFNTLVGKNDWDSLFASGDVYYDTETKIEVLKACEKYVKLTDSSMSLLLCVMAKRLFWGIHDKQSAEEYYKKAIELIDKDDAGLIMTTYYEYAYLLSSCGEQRYIDAIKMMNEAMKCLPFRGNNPMQTFEEHVCFYMDLGCVLTKNFLASNVLKRYGIEATTHTAILPQYRQISLFRDYAKILDHYGYILTIFNPGTCGIAEKALRLSLSIRSYLYELNSLEEASDSEYEVFTRNLLSRMQKAFIENDDSFWGDNTKILDYVHSCSELNKENVIEIFHLLSGSDLLSDISSVATTEDNLGYLLSYTGSKNRKEAKTLLLDALGKRRYLEDQEKNVHLSELSWTLTNLADLETMEKTKKCLSSARDHYLEAIELRETLCKNNRDKYKDNLARSCLGLARCCARQDDKDGRDLYYNRAVEIYKELSEQNTDYIPDLEYVMSLKDNLAKTDSIIGNQSHYSMSFLPSE